MRLLFAAAAAFLLLFTSNCDVSASPPPPAPKTPDTCFYQLLVPADIDMPSTPYFDTTIVIDRTCDVQILLLQSWGTETAYTLRGEVGGKVYERKAHFFHGSKGSRMMDITELPAGEYGMGLLACGNGGGFTLRLK